MKIEANVLHDHMIGAVADDVPQWFLNLLGVSEPLLACREINGSPCVFSDGILRIHDNCSVEQEQTKESFGFKWSKKETFESDTMLARMRAWLISRYGDVHEILSCFPDRPVLLDAGCGAGMSAIELWGEHFNHVNYLGIDVSTAVDVCRERMLARQFANAAFMQADITKLPLSARSVDIIFSEGVMHHTDDTRKTFVSLASLLKPNGFFMFYIYNKKGPIREFVDDYIRAKLQQMPPEEAWEAVKPLTKLGKILGELDITIRVPEGIELLDIPAGEINLQRLFYWHIFKAYYHPSLSLEEMNHINYDWYAPSNAHRHTFAEVQEWCQDMSMEVVRHVIEPAGITVVARKKS
ncbi:class I SAM-dependent methyltransferase [Legionella septentrionalis]|nr:class I SAM-dependent methyltransferase [Legionella septentrionalis]